jgi:signal transduction histidine kinase
MRRKALVLTGGAFLVGAVITALALIIPFDRYSIESYGAHVAIGAVASLAALMAAFLVYGRFRQSRLLNDLALVYALLVLAFDNVLFAGLSQSVEQASRQALSVWAPVMSALLTSATFFIASFVPPKVVRRNVKEAGYLMLAAAAATIVFIAVVAEALGPRLPAGIREQLTIESFAGPLDVGHPILLTAQWIIAAYFAIAAIGFVRRALQSDAELMLWFAAGSVLAAFCRVNYFFYPTLYSDLLGSGDALRFGFNVMLLIGTAREISVYWGQIADKAVLEERRRIARDLHDGLAQELGFISVRSKRLLKRNPEPELEQLVTAAERALDESRRAIAALTRPVDEPLDIALAQAVEEVAGRAGARVRLDLERDVYVAVETREALLRIAREAVSNAVRHGEASEVSGVLSNGSGLAMRIVDNGKGFELIDPNRTGFGLISMKERAKELGAEFQIKSHPGSGTEVELVLR